MTGGLLGVLGEICGVPSGLFANVSEKNTLVLFVFSDCRKPGKFKEKSKFITLPSITQRSH